MKRIIQFTLAFVFFCSCAHQSPSTPESKVSQYDLGKKAVESLTGCYFVDYNYTETDPLKPNYKKDNRVYDVNRSKAVKEWIYAEQISTNRIRLQHVLFATDLEGKLLPDSELKHQAEDWEYDAPFLYEFTAPTKWTVKNLKSEDPLWTRRITNLDDGLRYQCAGKWRQDTVYPEWSCDAYAPIPGRESRDMGRKDYNTLQRTTRVIVYGDSWLERQDNVKTVHEEKGRQPLAKEIGKDWYVRIPESECAMAKEFVKPRKAFWSLLRETWDSVLNGQTAFQEKVAQPPRFARMFDLEEKFRTQDISNPKVRADAQQAMRQIINDYRVN